MGAQTIPTVTTWTGEVLPAQTAEEIDDACWVLASVAQRDAVTTHGRKLTARSVWGDWAADSPDFWVKPGSDLAAQYARESDRWCAVWRKTGEPYTSRVLDYYTNRRGAYCSHSDLRVMLAYLNREKL